MSTKRISGKSFDVMVGDYLLHVDKASLTISDNGGVAMTDGIPDGYTDGDVSASGDIEIDTANFNILLGAAKSAGSWRELPPFDISFVADTGGSDANKGLRVDAAGCRLKIADLLSIDPKSADKQVHKLTFDVTDSAFVSINGVPYISTDETKDFR
jgi:hypothetical protein